MGDNPRTGEVYYERNVGSNSLTSEEEYDLTKNGLKVGLEIHSELDPFNTFRNCGDETVIEEKGQKKKIVGHFTPIVVTSDFTESRGDDIKTIDEKLPMFIGQIRRKNYVPYPMLSLAGVGDAKYDKLPLQVGVFACDKKIDQVLSYLKIERGGGGNGKESYELPAYFYAYHSVLACNQRGEKGAFFIIGDEGFYPTVSKDEVKRIIGDDLPNDLQTKDVFADLQKKYNVYFIYPKKPWEERKKNIDAEIRQRLTLAGGMYEGVDVRITLIWDTYDDLDIHCITPDGEEISFRNPESRCGGKLDVDRNAGKRETRKPVENIRWEKGRAKAGHYKVFVQNYAYHEYEEKPVVFRMEAEINGEIRHFQGVMKQGVTRDASNVTVFEFDYDPKAKRADISDLYANYDEKMILDQWASIIPRQNILMLENPKAITDVMLGALAVEAGWELETYLVDMEERGQTLERRKEVKKTLTPLSENTVAVAEIDRPLPGR